jgi:hypothetical protein
MKNLIRIFFSLWLTLSALAPLKAQTAKTGPTEGIRQNTPAVHALVGARIVPKPGRVIELGTLVLRDGIIVAVGADIKPPQDARVWDAAGLTVYPGLIEPYAHVGLGAADTVATPHWNPYVRSHFIAAESYASNKKEREGLRSLGYTAALIVPGSGLFHGSSALFSLTDGSRPRVSFSRMRRSILLSR